MRQGKSFLLNMLAKYLPVVRPDAQLPAVLGFGGPFAVSNTTEPCTKGIWLHVLPQDPDTGKTMILLDLEGLDSLEQDSNFDAQLFCLGVVFSSAFVLNTVGVIKNSSLGQLEVVVQFAQRLNPACQGEGEEEKASNPQPVDVDADIYRGLAAMRDHFPHFGWVLRDWDLEMEGTPKDYLERALLPVPQRSGSDVEKNRIRRVIREAFPVRRCFTLVQPVDNEADLGRLSEVPLKSTFLESFRDLALWLRNEIPAKTLMGGAVNGTTLATLAEACVAELQRGKLPSMDSTWGNVVNAEAGRCRDRGMELIRRRVDGFFGEG